MEQSMLSCNYCDILTNNIIICPNCKKNICYYCLMINMIHNDGKYLCFNCNYDLHDFIHNIVNENDDIKDENKLIDEYENKCVICYDTFDENDLIRCIHNHPHCRYCYNRIINNYNLSHVCGICRGTFIKKQKVHIKVQERPFDINDKVIKCKHCHERFEYDTLISYFTNKLKYNKDYYPECIHCHQKWDDKFIYDNFDIDYCKNILHIEDPYECKGCHIRFPKTYTCQYCDEEICINCVKKYFEEKVLNNKSIDCINCHHLYNEFDLYDDIFENDIDYVKNILHVRYPYECELCKKNLFDYIKYNICYNDSRYVEYISCDKCQRYFCKDCLYNYLRKLAIKYKNNTEYFRYVPEGFYKCPYCENKFDNSFLYSYYYDYYYDKLYLINNSKKCNECNKHHYCMFTCNKCFKNNCINCLCEGQQKRIAQHPDIYIFKELLCNYCGEIICDKEIYWKYLNDETCKSLKLETKYNVWCKENIKLCPICGNNIIKEGGCDHVFCIKCHSIFNWNSMNIIKNTNNPYYYNWLKNQ